MKHITCGSCKKEMAPTEESMGLWAGKAWAQLCRRCYQLRYRVKPTQRMITRCPHCTLFMEADEIMECKVGRSGFQAYPTVGENGVPVWVMKSCKSCYVRHQTQRLSGNLAEAHDWFKI